MSTIVYQELQSCHETQCSGSRSLSLKLSSPKLQFPMTQKPPNSNTLNCWSPIEELTRGSNRCRVTMEEEPKYVHPLFKRTTSVLSEKSLEMCTENLGSETGTDIIEDSIFSSPSLDSEDKFSKHGMKLNQKFESKKKESQNFPPPLSTLSGSNPIHVRPHRENGRLVMEAVAGPRRNYSYIQAERTEGRLRLSFCNEYASETEQDEEEEEENQEDSYDIECDKCDNEEIIEEEEEDVVKMSEDIDGITKAIGVKIGMEEFQRPSRCKEGGRGNCRRLINWEPYWVAT